MRFMLAAGLCSLTWAILGCSGGEQTAGAGFAPVDADTAVFWDRQTTESAAILGEITQEFNALHEGVPVKLEKAGGYGDIYRKVLASIQARVLPAMAVSYESMTSEYVPSGAVVALKPLISDPGRGIPQEELQDFFPVVLETNTYEAFGGEMYSFPFAKSVLMLYFNRRVLEAAGIPSPATTWDEFLEHCRQVKARTGKFGHAISVDCSTVSGLIFSMGGWILRDGETLYDAPEAVRVFELYETLAKEELAYQITPGTFDDEVALVNDEVAYTLRTSGGRLNMELAMGDPGRWGMVRIPQANPAAPGTVLFGPNITIFQTTPEQVSTAWAFAKHFTGVETQVRWALATGYLPVRQSAAEHPDMRAYWDRWEYNRAAFDCLAFAHPEPNVAGWQEVRGLVERELAAVLNGLKTGAQAAADLTQQADAVLARQQLGKVPGSP